MKKSILHKNVDKRKICKYFCVAACIFICSRATFLGQISPFCNSLAFALIYSQINCVFVVFCYFLAIFLQFLSFNGLIIAASASAILFIFGLICQTRAKNNKIFMIVFCTLSFTANIYFSLYSAVSLCWQLASLAIGTIGSVLFSRVILAINQRGVQCLSTKEKYCLYIFVFAIILGLNGIFVGNFDVSKAIFAFFILFFSATLRQKSIFLAALMGAAGILYYGSSNGVLNYFVFAIIAIWLVPTNRLLAGSMVCLADSCLGLLSSFSIMQLLPTILATIVFVGLPQSLLQRVTDYFAETKRNVTIGYYWENRQKKIREKLFSMSTLFGQMQKCYRNLLVGHAESDIAFSALAKELKETLCANCSKQLECYNGRDMEPCLRDLAMRAAQKGKVNFLDVPNLLCTYCTKINSVIANVNSVAQEYLAQIKKSQNADEGKLNISLQLGGTSKIFKELGTEFSSADKLNARKAAQIRDAMLGEGIVCRECMVIENENGLSEICVLVRNIDVVNPKLSEICEKIYPIRFEKKTCFQTKISGFSIVVLVPQPRYELLCGYARKARTVGDVSGDNYVYTKLTDTKYLLAIADGMGHGQKANEISSLTVNLVECYYKSGLSTNIILDSVNSILLPAASNSYSTLDATIVDTITGQVDFIKIGSSISVIKNVEGCLVIGVESLPLGVLDSVQPTTCTKVLSSGDIVVLASDGIVDMFATTEDFVNYVNNQNVINMQLFAENLLEEAEARTFDKHDDMTVIAYRLVQKR
jgi:stage II sporulation protein E